MVSTRSRRLALLLCLLPSTAWSAETLGVLAVAPAPGPTTELAEATTQLRQILAERNPAVLDARQTRERMAGQGSGASLDELDRAFDGARARAAAGDAEGSVVTLRAILDDLEKLPEGDEVYRQWTRASLRLAKTLLDLGQQEDARAVLERLARAASNLEVDPALFPPRFVKLAEEVRDGVKALPTHYLSVTSTNKPTKVYVNGRFIGEAPATVTLPRGRHRVSGIAGALRAPPVQVNLQNEDLTLSIDFTVPEALRPNLGPGLALPAADRARRLVAAGGYLGLDALLAVSVEEEAGAAHLVGSLYDVKRGMLTREGRVRLANKVLPVGGATALADFLITGQSTSALVEVPGQKRTVGTAPDLRPSLPPPSLAGGAPPGPPPSKTKGWVAFSSGVAAIGLTRVALWQISASNSYCADACKLLDANGQPTDSAKFNALRSSGDDARTVAVISGVAAGTCAVTSAILGYLAYQQTGEIGPFKF